MFGFYGLHMQFISFEWLKRCWEIDEMRRTRFDDDDDSAQVVRTMKNHNYFFYRNNNKNKKKQPATQTVEII